MNLNHTPITGPEATTNKRTVECSPRAFPASTGCVVSTRTFVSCISKFFKETDVDTRHSGRKQKGVTLQTRLQPDMQALRAHRLFNRNSTKARTNWEYVDCTHKCLPNAGGQQVRRFSALVILHAKTIMHRPDTSGLPSPDRPEQSTQHSLGWRQIDSPLLLRRF